MNIFSTRYHFVHNGKKSKDYPSLALATIIGARLVRAAGREYRVGLDDQFGMPRTFTNAVKRVRYLLDHKPVGHVVTLRASKDGVVQDRVVFRKALSAPPVKNSPGVLGVDRFEGWVEDTFPHARWAGDCVCKTTTSGGHSDHADCAAVDYFDTNANMEEMRDGAITNADYFLTKYVILFDRIYEAPNFSPQAYTGDYHYHVHFSCYGGILNSAC